jgi:uncharacterized protein YhbP (UPF0306 family)
MIHRLVNITVSLCSTKHIQLSRDEAAVARDNLNAKCLHTLQGVLAKRIRQEGSIEIVEIKGCNVIGNDYH